MIELINEDDVKEKKILPKELLIYWRMGSKNNIREYKCSICGHTYTNLVKNNRCSVCHSNRRHEIYKCSLCNGYHYLGLDCDKKRLGQYDQKSKDTSNSTKE